MTLKIKNIIYPNMYQAHGIAVDKQAFNIPTYQQTVDSTYASQGTITNAIKGIHEFLTNELELVEVPVDGEMDIDNIIEPPIHLTTTSTSSIPTNNTLLEPLYNAFKNSTTDSNTFKPIYGFKYYTFNDELNERKPLYLKINYGLFLLSKLGTSLRIRFAFAIEVEIKNSIYGSTITSSVLGNLHGQTATSSWAEYYTQTMEQKDSIGSHYDGVLYVNIFPKLGVRHAHTSNGTNISYTILNKVSYINFFLQRKEDYFIFMPFSYIGSQSAYDIALRGYNSTSISTGFYSYDGLSTYSTNDNVHVPFLSNRIVGNNTMAIFRSIDIDPVSSNIYENFNLCVGYNTMIQSSGAEIVIDNGNGTKSKYVTLSGIDSYHYLNSNKLAMIIKTDDIINE